MRLLLLIGTLLYATFSYANVELKIMCVEKSFSPNALRISVQQLPGGNTTLKKFTADNSISVEVDISDATYIKTGNDFQLEVDRGRSGNIQIKKVGNESLVTLNLWLPEAQVLNMSSENFACSGY